MNLFALADRKRTFVSELKDLTLEEIQQWIAFYDIQSEEIKESYGNRS